MKVQRQSLDRISALPQDTIENILSLMPIRDALRTSILSKKWRYCWTRMPKLVFNDALVGVPSDIEEMNKYKLVNAIFHVLLLHRGPISEIRICVVDTEISYAIDQMILHLSRRKNIKKLFLGIYEYYTLPRSFFSWQGLEHLVLLYCDFEPPLMFNGFSMLKTLIFHEVYITANMLRRFLTGCPLLEEFALLGYKQATFSRANKCTFLELFKCLPTIQVVNISRIYTKRFAAGGMSQKLPNSLVHLKILILAVCFQKQDELSSVLCVISSSPNLEKIELEVNLDLKDAYSGLKLDNLKELEITSFRNYAPEMEFVKLIMAKSPVLEKARLEIPSNVFVYEELKMLRDFLHLPFPRASPAAKFIIERPKY
ncbi:hypothetical protein L2E82_13938 [Cichorium intybus]|uniref:Uncharacterized protein n=1 Tax=Cichorium intybus TaxID=13427 RepID=A0ACB9EZ75_CICIN|nr:hypothetical protein L2E82_13938 [Cichorium intybus]